jgi:uncharacterized protein
MTTLLITLGLTFVVLLLVIAAMSIGVMRGRPAIRGSCGGLNGGGCELCGDGQATGNGERKCR